MNTEDQVKLLLKTIFPAIHMDAALRHFFEAVNKYQKGDWETSLLKIGKFVEAIIKSLYIYCGQTLPRSRLFKVGLIVRNLGQLNVQYDDTVRLLIPKACLFIYDIVSNRGTRHDPEDINPNEMDANIAISTSSWILAELVRFADSENNNTATAMDLVKELSTKKYPYAEKIGKRIYINIPGLSYRKIGLLILNVIYPNRISVNELTDLIYRHGASKSNARRAIQRLKNVVDDSNGDWKLRGIGREEADKINR